MNPERVCRVCLIGNVKMYDLKMYPLELYFKPFILNNPLSVYDLPNMVCYQCASLIKKFYLFREKCIKGQAVLYGIMDCSGSINPSLINKIDRKELKLASNLDIHTESPANIINYFHEPESKSIKFKFNGDLIEMPMPYEIKTEVIDDFKTEENDLFDYSFEMASSDDEPLSKYKSKKKRRKKLERQKEKEGNFDNFLDSAIENAEVVSSAAVSISNSHRGRGRPKKNTIDVPKALDELNSSISGENVKQFVKQKTRGRPKKFISAKPVKTKIFDEFDNVEDYAIAVRRTTEEQLEEVAKRQTSSNYLNSQYKCDVCYKGYLNTDTWRHHMNKHDPSAGEAECSICRVRFKSQRILQKHIILMHAMKFQCKSCSFVSKTKTQAKQHQRWHKGVTYTCQHCDEEFSKWTSYLSHVRNKHPSAHICPQCGYSFVSALGLAMHRSMMHKGEGSVEKTEDKDDPLFCSLCDVQFTTEDAYKRHLVTSAKHSSDATFSSGCKDCGEMFPNMEKLRLHNRKEHARKRPANYWKRNVLAQWPSKCMHCEESIENARDFWTHFRRAHPDMPYPIDKGYICDICGKGFRGNAFLKYHMRTHFNERAYKCAQCPKSFFNRTNLQMHEKIHSDSRPYPCQVCFKAFKTKGALNVHFRIHTGDKPFQCEQCGKAFSQSSSRKLHVRTVHLKQPAPYVSKSRMEQRRKALQTKLEPGTNFSVLDV